MKKLFTMMALAAMTLAASADDKVVSKETTWNFAEQAESSITYVKESNGLYFRAGEEERAIGISKGSKLSWTFEDGTTFSSTINSLKADLPANTKLAPGAAMNASDELGQSLGTDADNNNRTLAFTTSVPGTVYVAFRGGKTGYEDRAYKLFFRAKGATEYAEAVNLPSTDVADAKNQTSNLYYKANTGGTFVIGGNVSMSVYMVKFVPNTSTLWTFEGIEKGSLTTAGELQELNDGLWFRGGATSEYNITNVGQKTGSFSNGMTWCTSQVAALPAIKFNAASLLSKRQTAERDYSSNFRRGFAFNTNEAGTCHVAFSCAIDKVDATKNYQIYFSYTEADGTVKYLEATKAIENTDITELTLEAPQGGTFWIFGGVNNSYVHAILFDNGTSMPTVKASVSDAEYATFVTTSAVKVPEDVKVLTVSTTSRGIKTSEVATGTVIAEGTPVVLNASAGTVELETAKEAGITPDDNKLLAATKDIEADGTQYCLTKNSAGKVGFAKVAVGTTIPTGKAYLSVTQEMASAEFFGLDGSVITGIKRIKNAAKTDDAYYTIQGMKVAHPTKGVYIRNGKKVVVE